VTLIVVTKTFPASDIALLRELGVRHIGENRHQEAEQKVAELSELDITWHFVGQVQSNKAARIAGYADVVHSVDSAKVVDRLQRGAHERSRPVDCFVQVDLDPADEHAQRGGAAGDLVSRLADLISDQGMLRLVGVMAVAPLGRDPVPAYQQLVEISHRLRGTYPDATAISAGMSGDFEAAVAAGATHVRVGSAVLGERALLG
jgi:pyridoxal phosphate enzyme (YggS family)